MGLGRGRIKVFSTKIRWLAVFAGLFIALHGDAQVTAGFSSDSTEGCGVLELSMINLSSGATSYLWQVYNAGGGLVTSSTLTNPTFFLISAGSYTISLTAYGGGDSDNITLTDFATVYTPPVSSFTASGLSGCVPFTATFTDTSIPGSFGSIDNFYWVITGAGTLPETPTLTYTFMSPGTYIVYLFVEDAAGCTDYASVSVNVLESPVASFTSGPATGCSVPFSIDFTNTSTGTGTLTYFWDFGDGATSTATDPSHTYSAIGNYDVTLIVSNDLGCSDTAYFPDYVQINPTAAVDFTPSETSICVGQEVSFDNASGSGTGTWSWDFGDGTTSDEFEPSHVYDAAGTYTVSLSADFGGGCTGSVTYPALIEVDPAPTVTFTSTDPSSVCELPFSVTFTPVITGSYTSIVWTFEDSGFVATSNDFAPTYTWNQQGSYDVSVTVTNASGCSDTYLLSDYVTIGSLVVTPVATPEFGCFPLHVNFSALAGEPLVSYQWDFGDGTSSAMASPSHLYPGVGCYTISLIASSINGCTDTTVYYDYVCVGDTGTALVVLPDTSCPGVAIDVGYLPLDSIVCILDGGSDFSSSSNVDSTTVINFTPGEHDVDVVTWSYGCPDTFSTSIYILDVDDSLMNVIYTCDDPYTMQIFIDSTLMAESCGWLWDFGDGTTDSVSVNPVHTYADAGTYTVAITYFCITPQPCSGTGRSVQIMVPQAGFTMDPSMGCDTPMAVQFTDTSMDGIDNIFTYNWLFGDGGSDTSQNPLHTYSAFGDYIVDLDATDTRGCDDHFQDTVHISTVYPYFTTDVSTGCVPLTVVATDSSGSLSGAITMWVWDWNDGTTDTFYNASDVEAVSHTFTYQKHFHVTLTVTNAYGCTASYTHDIVASQPIADFMVDDTLPCLGSAVNFTQLSTGYTLNFLWDFGDGTTSTLADPSHTYADMGAYDVSLIVSDMDGCTDTLTKPAYVTTDTADGDFYFNTVIANCNYDLVQFFVTSDDSICSYFWTFGDGGTSTDPNPVYPYLFAGAYDVSLTMTNCNGCSASISKVNYVIVPGPFGTITYSDDSLCVGDSLDIYLSVASSDTVFLYFDNGDVQSYDVDFSDTLVTITIPYVYNSGGDFFPTALCEDTSGCFNVITGVDTLHVRNNPVSYYTLPDPDACLGSSWVFTDSSYGGVPIVNWDWSTGDSAFSVGSSISFTHAYAAAGDYSTQLIVTSDFGCVDTSGKPVSVYGIPTAEAGGDTTICEGSSVQLYANGGDTYTWTPSTGLSSNSIANPVSTADSTILYYVEVSNGYCSDYDSVLISVINKLIIDAGPDTTICPPATVQLYAEFAGGIPEDAITYMWTPPDFLSDPLVTDPTSNALHDIVYVIHASCGTLEDSAFAAINVATPPDVELPEDTIFLLNGQSIELIPEVTSTSDVTYAWEPASEVDCPDCPTVNVAPGQSTLYSVQVTDTNGCTDIDFIYVRLGSCDAGLFKIPNIITPNGDGLNDEFHFTYEGIAEVRSWKIFDRWGALMFSSQSLEDAWDGTYHGQLCNPGVYVYMIDAVCTDGTPTIISGNVTLVK